MLRTILSHYRMVNLMDARPGVSWAAGCVIPLHLAATHASKVSFLKRKGSEAFAKVEEKAPPSQPGLEPGSSAYAADALSLSGEMVLLN